MHHQLCHSVFNILGVDTCMYKTCIYNSTHYRIDCVMVGWLAPSAVDHWFESHSGQTKADGICCFSAKEKEQRLVDSESE